MGYGTSSRPDVNQVKRMSRLEYGLEREYNPKCEWRDRPNDQRCGRRAIDGLPVCEWHGLRVSARMARILQDRESAIQPDDADHWPTDDEISSQRAQDRQDELERRRSTQAFVYYLMLTPETVKIGTTRDLRSRIASHGSKLQYVVALEFGSYDVERARHRQFPMERHGIEEVFSVSEALRTHIELLALNRDEMVAYALTLPPESADTPTVGGR